MTSPIRKIHQSRCTLIKQKELSFATDMDRCMRMAMRLFSANRKRLVLGQLNVKEFRDAQNRVRVAVANRNFALYRAYFGEQK